jgi:protein-S-isoprenylcysteine O-methyltransferase Ste14
MKRIMPPTLFYACIISMVLLAWLWPVRAILPFPVNLIGLAPLVLGLGIAVWGSRKFEEVGTTIKTFDEPQQLVTDGLFRFTRNPMYLGFALALVGVWCLLGALSPVLGVMGFVIVAERWYIRFEERMLAQRFGREFETYRATTRRWI